MSLAALSLSLCLERARRASSCSSRCHVGFSPRSPLRVTHNQQAKRPTRITHSGNLLSPTGCCSAVSTIASISFVRAVGSACSAATSENTCTCGSALDVLPFPTVQASSCGCDSFWGWGTSSCLASSGGGILRRHFRHLCNVATHSSLGVQGPSRDSSRFQFQWQMSISGRGWRRRRNASARRAHIRRRERQTHGQTLHSAALPNGRGRV